MKTKFITATGALMALWLTPPTGAIAATCLTYGECADKAQVGCIDYCCKTGSTGTAYTCPDDWDYNLTSGLCERDAFGDSDSTGYYTPNYGTCAATTSTYDCYKTSSTSSGTGCRQVALPVRCGDIELIVPDL